MITEGESCCNLRLARRSDLARAVLYSESGGYGAERVRAALWADLQTRAKSVEAREMAMRRLMQQAHRLTKPAGQKWPVL
jgi:hypothetical protein